MHNMSVFICRQETWIEYAGGTCLSITKELMLLVSDYGIFVCRQVICGDYSMYIKGRVS